MTYRDPYTLTEFGCCVEYRPKEMTQAWHIIYWCDSMLGQQTIAWTYKWLPGDVPRYWYFVSQQHALLFQLTWGGSLQLD